MKKRILLELVAVILIILACVLLYARANTNKPENVPNSELHENVSKVVNQGENFLEYDKSIYYVDCSNNTLTRYDLKSKASSVIYSAARGSTLGNRIFIQANQLIYTLDGNTYYCSLDGKSQKKLTDGEVVYVNDNAFLYLLQEPSVEYLCMASYNNISLERTIDYTYNLVKGNKIRFIRAADNLLLFSSVNSDESSSLFMVDIDGFKTTLLAREFTSDSLSRFEIVDAQRKDDDIYYVVSKFDKSTDHETLAYNALYIKPIYASFTELDDEDIDSSLYMDASHNLAYKRYDIKTSKYEWYAEGKSVIPERVDEDWHWQDYIVGDITKYVSFVDGNIYINDKIFAYLGDEFTDYNLLQTCHYSDKIYILVSDSAGKSYAWFSCKDDASELVLIYKNT